MRHARIVLLSCASIMLSLISATPSFPGVRVELSNGRSITADSCSESGTSLFCYKMGGSFAIDKRDIVSVRSTEGEEASEDEGTPPEAVADGDREEEGGNTGKVSADDAALARKSSAERLEEIRKRKLQLLEEREKLAEERRQLQEEVKKAPDWMPTKQFDELNKKNADIDARIKKFNEETKALNEEEKKIRGEMTPATQGSAESRGAEVAPAE